MKLFSLKKTIIFISFFAIAVSLTLLGCKKKEEVKTEPIKNTFSAELHFEILKATPLATGGNTTKPLKDATIKLYETEEDYNANINIKFQQNTDSLGKTVFGAVDKEKYFVNISSSNSSPSKQIVTTSNKSKTYNTYTVF